MRVILVAAVFAAVGVALGLLSPVTIKGAWRKPKIGIEPGPAIAQGLIGLGLGALIHPLAAILPFVEPGGAKDADCASLLAQAGAKGAR